MQGMSCLYRRSSGIYAVRLVVPKRLRESIGRTDIHTSTGVRSLAVAKTEALRIQLHWRKHFQAMDAEKLRNESPLIAGDGMISIMAAADAIGISPGALAGELLNDRAQVYTHVQRLRGWAVPDLNDIERDYNGGLILNDVERKGVETTHSGMVRFLDMPQANKVMIQMHAVMAEWERDQISKRTKDALAAAKARGVKLGTAGAANLKPNVEARQRAADAFAVKVAGMVAGFQGRNLSQRDMVAELNALGIKTPNGGTWHRGQLCRLLERIDSA
ncbi:recombinase family protein [Burkholderia multivorans]|uniref:recombinase family protein n=1 Tax=Burkholderia multivorans TaxID=87883 RepID=UPI0009E0C968|nr:recombinase family protein [Burkholderia multivorans]SAK06894.1 integrase family protein [Burkholderia multivorans]SAK09649.1 integrase family protein [Burkholderia multivorans]